MPMISGHGVRDVRRGGGGCAAVGAGDGAAPAAGITWVAGAAAAAGASTVAASPPMAEAGSRSAAAKAEPSAKRSAGDLLSARRTTPARSAGTDAGSSGTGSRTCASAEATGESAT